MKACLVKANDVPVIGLTGTLNCKPHGLYIHFGKNLFPSIIVAVGKPSSYLLGFGSQCPYSFISYQKQIKDMGYVIHQWEKPNIKVVKYHITHIIYIKWNWLHDLI